MTITEHFYENHLYKLDESIKNCESQIEDYNNLISDVNNRKLKARCNGKYNEVLKSLDEKIIKKYNEELNILDEKYKELKSMSKECYKELCNAVDSRKSKEEWDTWSPVIGPLVFLFVIWVIVIFATHGDSFILFQ